MSASGWSGAIDYLLTNLPAVVTAVDPDGIVQEGYANEIRDTMVMVACEHPENAAAGERTNAWVTFGGHRLAETWSIPGYIDCAQAGSDQSATRKRALSILDGLVDLIRNDPGLSGLIQPLTSVVTGVTMTATEDSQGDKGRRTVITWRLEASNRI